MVWNGIRKSVHENGRQNNFVAASANGLNELVNYYKFTTPLPEE